LLNKGLAQVGKKYNNAVRYLKIFLEITELTQAYYAECVIHDASANK